MKVHYIDLLNPSDLPDPNTLLLINFNIKDLVKPSQ